MKTQTINRIYELYDAGLTATEISKIVNVSVASVCIYIKRRYNDKRVELLIKGWYRK